MLQRKKLKQTLIAVMYTTETLKRVFLMTFLPAMPSYVIQIFHGRSFLQCVAAAAALCRDVDYQSDMIRSERNTCSCCSLGTAAEGFVFLSQREE
jgi:hypothetical protein